MARSFVVDSRYTRYVEASIVLILADVGRDIRRRERGDAPTIAEPFIDPLEIGDTLILVGSPSDVAEHASQAEVLQGRGK